jgi:anaerobic selenocysteine-containing dehydrogenase
MPPDAGTMEIVPSACPHDCPSTCALEVERLDANTIGRVHGAKDNPYTAGVVCAKVARYAERVHNPARLKTPLRRVGDKGRGLDAFQPISWDDALDIVADAFLRAAERHGSETVWPYYYAGTMGLLQRDGIQRLRHVMKYSHQHSTICTGLSKAGWVAGIGAAYGSDSRQLEAADLIVVWGGNPVHTQVNLMTHLTRARKERGAKLVVVDPYRTQSAAQADMHLALKPGTDGALACAVMHVMFKEGHADRAYLAAYADDPAGLEAHLATRGPAWAAAITGLSEAEIVDFARLYGRTENAFIRAGYGFTRSRNGAVAMHAITCLPTVGGKWKHPGGGALYSNSGLYNSIDKTLIEGLDAYDPSIRKLDQTRLGPVLAGDPQDIGDGPPVTALLIQNTNPMMVCPETRKVREGFLRDDLFVCVHEQIMTETAAMADIVLPATTFLEHEDYYIGSAHTYLQVTRPVIEPHAEARPNHFVHCALAERLGAEHPGFHMTGWELIDESLRRSGLPGADEAADMRWVDCALPRDEMNFRNGFGWPDRRFRLSPDWSAVGRRPEGLPEWPDHCDIIDTATPDKPFRLVTAPSRSFLNSSFSETPGSRAREGRPTLKIHPDAAAALGIGDGDRVRVGNDRAEIGLHAEHFDGLQPDVVVIEGLWPNADFEGGLGVNALTSADPGPPFGGGVFHDTAVWVRPPNG